ncbi:MAG: cytidine deaminase [Prevotellaceae bacterium]|jgi:cytidine deaminase|nr:cytidine deaminase [Prevotellaceae bacterium]
MKSRNISITVEEYGSFSELATSDKQLVQQAREASKNAYSPYSHFQVGAAVLLSNGEVVAASNQENGAYPSGLCAERTALFYAGARFPGAAVVAIAIAAQSGGRFCARPVYPCGACRQVMLESEMRGGQPVRIIMDGEQAVEVVQSAHDLLPLSFTLE